ncbi:uncharacterized protein LOC6606514 [Drosophila sechellia]|uniref:GM24114 n=1 Tax=Drosophila sechellia TaxID=7238 RepID=B4HFR6_DROSE|nr:uncharacterized protein LOC6606514 [Drosophila sechellia]EDW42301.1 GM24114 [Drosophila sechellia]
MVKNLDKGLMLYQLMLSFPLRMALYAVYVYLENLLGLMLLIQEVLILQFIVLCLVIRWVYPPWPTNGGIPRSLRFRTRKYLNIFLTIWVIMLHTTTYYWNIPCHGIMQLSRLFRICAYGRTWFMMQPHNGAQR